MYDEEIKRRRLIDKQLRDSFPYYLPNDSEGSGVFFSAHIGTSDEYSILIRINFDKSSVTFGIVDDHHHQFLLNNIEDLKAKASEIIKKRIDKDKDSKKNAMKADLESMKLCGFLTRNDLTYSLEKNVTRTVVNIFGTAFEKLPIYIYKSDPNVYVIVTPRASFNQKQVESFVLTCKSLKE
jgi:hypothetical protein